MGLLLVDKRGVYHYKAENPAKHATQHLKHPQARKILDLNRYLTLIERLHKVDEEVFQEETSYSQERDLRRKPEGMYVNIHATDTLPQEKALGKVRHQLLY